MPEWPRHLPTPTYITRAARPQMFAWSRRNRSDFGAMTPRSFTRTFATLFAMVALGACAETDSEYSEDDYLTSNTALQRTLKFDGLVYVPKGTPDVSVALTIKKQTQTAFGALRTSNVGVATRELGNVDSKTFKRRTVSVVDTVGSNAPYEMDEVRYTYTDAAVVPKSMARRSALPLGLLNFKSTVKDAVLKECTANDTHAQEFADGAMWYVFEPSVPTCSVAMRAEQTAIDTERKKLTNPTKEVTLAEVSRTYIPTVMALGAANTNTRPSYPEYDKLFSGVGGAEPGKLVVSIIQGMQADWAAGQKTTLLSDGAYQETLAQFAEVLKARPGLKLVSSEGADFTKLVVNGKNVPISGVDELIAWEESSVPAAKLAGTGLKADDLRMAGAKLMHKRWLTFEAPLKVTTRGVKKDLTLKVNVYFGAEQDGTPYRKAIKGSDVFTYNGHSYIGYGPLDPKNYSAADFSSGYQLFFINSCVSYNYYDGDYFPRKTGATKTLDIVSNGLESYQGHANKLGAFLAALLSGTQPKYSDLLKAADEGDSFWSRYADGTASDPLRVVDGELDNVYKPNITPITLE